MWVLCIVPAAQAEDVLLIMGDSLSAGYGIARAESWPALLEQRLNAQGMAVRIVNASVSGETSASSRVRLPALLQKHQPRWVLIELGANDGLRGLSLEALRANLAEMQQRALASGATPILAAMRIPTNYGTDYAQQVYEITRQPVPGAIHLPFMLDGVAGQPAFNLDDGIHPNAEGQRRVLENIWPTLHDVLNYPASLPKGQQGSMRSVPQSSRDHPHAHA